MIPTARFTAFSLTPRLLWVGVVFVFVVVFLITNLLNAMLLMVRIVAQAPKLLARCFFMLRPVRFSSRLHGRRNFVVRAHLFSPPTFGLPCSLYVVYGLLSLLSYHFVSHCHLLLPSLHPFFNFVSMICWFTMVNLCAPGASYLHLAIVISWFQNCVMHVFNIMAYYYWLCVRILLLRL